jgi:hypothetical protein
MSHHPETFPYPHYVDHENKTVWMYVASGWPTVMAIPQWMKHYFPEGYRGSLCTLNFIKSLKKNEQKESR